MIDINLTASYSTAGIVPEGPYKGYVFLTFTDDGPYGEGAGEVSVTIHEREARILANSIQHLVD